MIETKIHILSKKFFQDSNEDELAKEEEEKHQPKAPPPCIPTNIFSPTEKKTMEFPDPIVQEPPPPPPVSEPEPKKDTIAMKKVC